MPNYGFGACVGGKNCASKTIKNTEHNHLAIESFKFETAMASCESTSHKLNAKASI
jgi:hypothetical protein